MIYKTTGKPYVDVGDKICLYDNNRVIGQITAIEKHDNDFIYRFCILQNDIDYGNWAIGSSFTMPGSAIKIYFRSFNLYNYNLLWCNIND